MAEREITLFHGTDVATAESRKNIYGYLMKKRPDASAGLTDDLHTAQEFALRKTKENRRKARVLEIKLPRSQVRRVGVIANFGAYAFVTRDRVSASRVPTAYLKRTPLDDRDIAIDQEELGLTSFYRVKRENVVAVHRLK